MRVTRARGFNPGEVEALTGLDDGQGLLKVAMVENDEDDKTKDNEGRSKYTEV